MENNVLAFQQAKVETSTCDSQDWLSLGESLELPKSRQTLSRSPRNVLLSGLNGKSHYKHWWHYPNSWGPELSEEETVS